MTLFTFTLHYFVFKYHVDVHTNIFTFLPECPNDGPSIRSKKGALEVDSNGSTPAVAQSDVKDNQN